MLHPPTHVLLNASQHSLPTNTFSHTTINYHQRVTFLGRRYPSHSSAPLPILYTFQTQYTLPPANLPRIGQLLHSVRLFSLDLTSLTLTFVYLSYVQHFTTSSIAVAMNFTHLTLIQSSITAHTNYLQHPYFSSLYIMCITKHKHNNSTLVRFPPIEFSFDDSLHTRFSTIHFLSIMLLVLLS